MKCRIFVIYGVDVEAESVEEAEAMIPNKEVILTESDIIDVIAMEIGNVY